MSFRIVAVLGVVTAASPAGADGVVLTQKGDHHTTEGEVTVDATPDQVYAFATDYAHWEQQYSDAHDVKVEPGATREHARVWFDSRAIGHRVLVELDNVPGRTIRFRGIKGPPGGVAHGEYRFEPVDGGKRTRIVADLYLDIQGPVGWFVSDARTRKIREAKLRADLADTVRYFARPVASREPPAAAPPR